MIDVQRSLGRKLTPHEAAISATNLRDRQNRAGPAALALYNRHRNGNAAVQRFEKAAARSQARSRRSEAPQPDGWILDFGATR